MLLYLTVGRSMRYTYIMRKIIQVRIYKGDKYFVAECLDVPVVTQGKTLDELAENLKEAIALQFQIV